MEGKSVCKSPRAKAPGLLLQNLKPTSDENAAHALMEQFTARRGDGELMHLIRRASPDVCVSSVKVLPEMKKLPVPGKAFVDHLDESLLPQPIYLLKLTMQ